MSMPCTMYSPEHQLSITVVMCDTCLLGVVVNLQYTAAAASACRCVMSGDSLAGASCLTQVAKILDLRTEYCCKTASLRQQRIELSRSLQARSLFPEYIHLKCYEAVLAAVMDLNLLAPTTPQMMFASCLLPDPVRPQHLLQVRHVPTLVRTICQHLPPKCPAHAQDVSALPMKTALRQCTELMRQTEEAARKELHLYNDYFLDVLFRSMLPRQRVHTPPCREFVMVTFAQPQDAAEQPACGLATGVYSWARHGVRFACRCAP